MNETMQLMAIAVVALCELYAMKGGDIPVLAYFWDFIARVTGAIANWFADISMNARLAYYEVTQ